MLRLKRAATLAAILVAAACTDHAISPTAPTAGGPRETISDAAHAGAVPGFYFLPPMVPQPSYSGTFDAALQPTVMICELAGPVCATTVATFTFGTGSGNVKLDAAGQQYSVNWKTSDYNLDPAKNYRISVYQGSFLLGYADVDVVGAAKDLKNVDTNQYIALLDDRTLPIKFRIETGIVGSVTVTPASDSVFVGDSKQFTASCTDLHGNAIACPATTWSSLDTNVATVSGTGLATGVNPGTVTITASIGYAQGTATLKVIQPNTPPVANPDSFQAIGNVTIPVAAPGVLANDTDAETPGGLSVVPGTVATTNGGTATLAADGSFTYLSAPGYVGGDSFSYTVTDGSLTATGTVTMTSTYRVWYADNSGAAPGDGRDASPFTALASAEGAPAAGETIFLRYGNGTAVGYDAGFTFKAGQSLIGQGVPSDVTAVVNGQPLVLLQAGSAPTVTNAAAGATLTLATNNTAQGFNVNSTSGPGISGNGFGTFAASDMEVAATGGPSLDLQGGTLAATFASLSSTTSNGPGLHLDGVGGTLTAPAGLVTGAFTYGVDVVGGGGTVTYGGSISGSGARAARVTGRTGGAVTLSGNVTDAGGGILVQSNLAGSISFNGASKVITTGASNAVTLSSNGGATINFGGGGLALTTAGGTGFSATGGGTVNVTGANNVINVVGGTGLSVVSTTIGASGLSFRSISASNDANGIVLASTGAVNGLQVTGNGSAGSGGTLRDMTGSGVLLSGATNVFLTSMEIRNTGASGVKGTGVVNFAFTDGLVDNSGTAGGTNDSNLAFNTAALGTENNVSGTLSITGSTLTNARYHGVDVVNYSGTLSSVSISGNTVTSSTSAAASLGSGIRLLALGSAGTVANVSAASITNNVVQNFPSGAGIQVQGGNGNAGGPAGTFGVAGNGSSLISITGNRIAGQAAAAKMGSSAIIANVTGVGQGNFDISGNGTVASPLANITGTVISHSVLGPGTVTSTVNNNVIAAANTVGAQGIGVGADALFSSADAPSLDVTVSGNSVSGTDGNGILAVARGSAASMRAKVQNNTVAAPLTGVRQGIRIDSGSAIGNASVCLNISGNTSAGSGGARGIGLRKQGTNPAVNAFAVNGMVATATPAVEAYVNGLNPAGGLTQLISATSGFSNCSLP
ncbi:MAG TPA: Ig-like domain-containing protein [Longimicrobiaceae bacterium]|nr:Ig-like domain-containing protein [Longimicrobiaceae bacterium]